MQLPIFPLEVVAFPHEDLPLHIFEPRYRQLIEECEKNGITFGISPVVDGKLAEYGTEMELVSVITRYKSGESDVITKGKRVFRLNEFIRAVPDKLYSAADVTMVDNDSTYNKAVLDEIRGELAKLTEMSGADSAPWDIEDEDFTFRVAPHVGLTMEQKIRLLSLPVEADRQDVLLPHLKELVPAIRKSRAIRKRVRGNGHFKKFPVIDVEE